MMQVFELMLYLINRLVMLLRKEKIMILVMAIAYGFIFLFFVLNSEKKPIKKPIKNQKIELNGQFIDEYFQKDEESIYN